MTIVISACSPEYYFNSTVYRCVICPVGTFSEVEDVGECTACVVGITAHEGSTSRAQCVPGKRLEKCNLWNHRVETND